MIRDGRDNRSCLRRGRVSELGMKGISIRRLTPLECERLQGFPDGWTAEGIDEKGNIIPISDTQRYKTIGNAISVPIVQAILERLGNPISATSNYAHTSLQTGERNP